MYRILPRPVSFPSPAAGPPGGGGRRPEVLLALAVVASTLLAACVPFAASPASAATILVVSPNSIRAGFSVMLRATCGDNVNPAFVSSAAFGSLTLVPSHGEL